jgi:hypothetical protein
MAQMDHGSKDRLGRTPWASKITVTRPWPTWGRTGRAQALTRSLAEVEPSAKQVVSFKACAGQVGFNRGSSVKQPHGLFDQKPGHPAPNDQDCTDYKGGGIDVLGARRHGLVNEKAPPERG